MKTFKPDKTLRFYLRFPIHIKLAGRFTVFTQNGYCIYSLVQH